jgi:phosphatidylserine/phosphatidylglycerophosphate/cardiolipin synthase-like enzyme
MGDSKDFRMDVATRMRRWRRMSDTTSSILVTGTTCWKVAEADRLSVVVDAADFFVAAKKAMLEAERSILIVGWDFDARIKLEPEGRTMPGPNRIGAFLEWLARRRPALTVRILKWDVGTLHAFGRGETPFVMLRWMFGRRVRLRLDTVHPSMSSHHMKLLVIDGKVVFCGGIDMTQGRWDTPMHREGQPGRRSAWGRQLKPWHDATTCLSGPAAEVLAEVAEQRWARATGEVVPPPATEGDPWPKGLRSDFQGVPVGVARTVPAHGDWNQVSEIEESMLAAIADAQDLLYVESQFFASRRIASAIAQRLSEDEGPEIVVINPDSADGWLETLAMDSARIRLLHMVRRSDVHDRFRIFHPVNDAGTPIYVHAKIMVVDDRVLRIGSANLNNRSMGFDTECDVIVEPDPKDRISRKAIAFRRNALLAEHMGTTPTIVEETLWHNGGSLIRAIDALNVGDRRLVPLPVREMTEVEKAFAESDLADPIRPVGARKAFSRFYKRIMVRTGQLRFLAGPLRLRRREAGAAGTDEASRN